MTDSANVFLTFTGGPYTTHLTFDNPYVGNYIGTLGGYPSVVGNTAVKIIGGIGSLLVNASGLTLSNTTVNTTIPVPNSAQHAANTYFLNANGSWAIPPYPSVAGLTGAIELFYYFWDGVAVQPAHDRYINVANGLITSVT